MWVILLTTVLIYWPVWSFPFTGYDDNGNVGANPDFNPVTGATLRKYWTEPHMDMYIPVAYTAWAGLAAVSRTQAEGGAWVLDASAFHGANMILHAGAALVVYAILRRLLHAGRAGESSGGTEMAAGLGAVLFAVHPLQVEAVAWVSGLRDVLGGVLALVSTWCYVDFATGERGTSRRWRAYVVALAAFALSMLSKPSAMSLPVALAAIDVLLLRRPWRATAAALLPWVAAAASVAVITKVVQPTTTMRDQPLWVRPLVALDAIWFYLTRIVAPLKLGIDYGRSPEWLRSQVAMYWTWIGAAVVIAVVVIRRRRWPLVATGLAVFLAMLLPVLGLTKFEFQRHSTVADRYAYLALLGAGVALAAVVRRYPNRGTVAVVGMILAAYAARAYAQVWTWKDSYSVFAHALEVNPTSLAGNTWMGLYEAQSGHADRALQYYSAALAEHPDDPVVHYDRGDLLLAIGEPAAAAESFAVALANGRDEWDKYFKLAAAQERSGDHLGAEGTIRRGVVRWPKQPELHELLGALLAQRGDYAAAQTEYEAALAIDPRRVSAGADLAAIRRRLAATREAVPAQPPGAP